MKKDIFKNEVFEEGYIVQNGYEYTYKVNGSGQILKPIRDIKLYVYDSNEDDVIYRASIEDNPDELRYNFAYCNGVRGVIHNPPKSNLSLIKKNKIKTLSPFYSTIKTINVDLNVFMNDLQKVSLKLSKDSKSNLDYYIEVLLDKYGTLQNRESINHEKYFDKEIKLWQILLTKLVPSVSSFIDSKKEITLNELNECFKGVKPVYDSVSKNAFKLESQDLLGAISLFLKTHNLKKPPIINCLNCGKEINQSQKGGRPIKFCKNNNKCKMQYHRK